MIYALLLAGGYGIRFWPKSRLKEPKQFLRLEGKKNLLQVTAGRLEGFVARKRLYVVSLASQGRRIRQELPFLEASQVVGEPVGRNTAAAIVLGTSRILQKDPEAVLCVFPSDQWIGNRRLFYRCLTRALQRAEEGKSIVLCGVKPTRPETGYGYIEMDRRRGRKGLYPVKRFIEKPTLPRAKRLLKSKGVFWNSGMAVFKGSFLMKALKTTQPRLAAAFSKRAGGSLNRRSLRRLYAALPSVSFDTGVLERFPKIESVVLQGGWEDVGSWASVVQRSVPDRKGNIIWGEAFPLESRRNFIVSDRRHLVSLFGVSDLAVIHTAEATLVCPKERLGRLKLFVETLKRQKKFRQYL